MHSCFTYFAVAYILNLIVQDGLKVIGDGIQRVRDSTEKQFLGNLAEYEVQRIKRLVE